MSEAGRAPGRTTPSGSTQTAAGQLGLIKHRPWSTVLLVLIVLAFLPTTAATAFGAILRLRYRDDDTEGISTFVGSVLLAFGVVGTLLTAALVVVLVLGRRRADTGSPRTLFGAAVSVVTLAAVAVAGNFAWTLVIGRDLGTAVSGIVFGAPVTLPFLLVAARLATRCRPPTRS